jgi:uncharacterized membrane protein (Fun14 family)
MDPSVLFSLGGGVIAGIAVGMALKAALRWALIFMGLIILGLVGLMNAGIIVIQWDALSKGLEGGVSFLGGYVKLALADLSAQLVGFTGGMVMGFKWR